MKTLLLLLSYSTFCGNSLLTVWYHFFGIQRTEQVEVDSTPLWSIFERELCFSLVCKKRNSNHLRCRFVETSSVSVMAFWESYREPSREGLILKCWRGKHTRMNEHRHNNNESIWSVKERYESHHKLFWIELISSILKPENRNNSVLSLNCNFYSAKKWKFKQFILLSKTKENKYLTWIATSHEVRKGMFEEPTSC